MEKEKWIEEVIDSTVGMRPVAAPPFLYEKIMMRAESKRPAGIRSFQFPAWAAAAVFILLLNAVTIFAISQRNKKYNEEKFYSDLSTEMGLTSSYQY